MATHDNQFATPDFIIAGAMKSGTTWLHRALNSLPDIAIPDEEIHILDYADPCVHPDFILRESVGLSAPKFSDLSWVDLVGSFSKEQRGATLVGWDSTTLFHSRSNFSELAKEHPDLKILIVLRNPTSRAYSHYWHLVRTGRATKSFEKEITQGNMEILERSIYRDQALKIKEAFGERVHFVLYEALFSEPEVEFSKLLAFLGLAKENYKLIETSLSVRENSGVYPNWLAGWLFVSGICNGLKRGRYAKNTTRSSPVISQLRYLAYKLKIVLAVLGGFGYSLTRKRPMKPGTKSFLDEYFQQANYDIDSITGLSSDKYWGKRNDG